MLSTAIYEQKSQIDWAVITQQIIPFKFYLFWISSNNLINQVNMDTSFGKPSTNSSFIVLLYPFRFNNGIVLFNSNLVKALHRSGFQSIVKIIDKKLHIQISSKLITFLPSRRFPLVLSARLFLLFWQAMLNNPVRLPIQFHWQWIVYPELRWKFFLLMHFFLQFCNFAWALHFFLCLKLRCKAKTFVHKETLFK